MDRAGYFRMYGATVGDRVRLGEANHRYGGLADAGITINEA